MLRSFLSAAIVLALFPNSSGTNEDILEFYHPDPRLPTELNEWLSIVQEHKNDFRLIREAAENRRRDKNEQAEEHRIRSNAKREFHYLFDESEDEYDTPTSPRPSNSIYPRVYYNDKSQARPRRYYDVNFDVAGKTGEIGRPGDKYPDRYKSNPNKKREVEIDIIKDGKLVKRIEDDQKRAKSYVFNVEEAKKSANNDNQRHHHLSSSFIQPMRQKSSIQRDELNGNFKNLYDANEHLNTDASVLKEDPFVYRVTLPDVDAYLHSTSIATEDPIKNNNFHHNELQDMSPFWTGTEKQIMQKGIDFAQKFEGLPKPGGGGGGGFESVRSVVVDYPDLQQQDPQRAPDDSGTSDPKLTLKVDDELQLPPPRSIVRIAFEKPSQRPDYLNLNADSNDLYLKPDKVFDEVRAYKRRSSNKRKRDLNFSCAKIEEITSNPLPQVLDQPLGNYPSGDAGQNVSNPEVYFDYPGTNFGYMGNLDGNAISNEPKTDVATGFPAPEDYYIQTTSTEPATEMDSTTWRPFDETLQPPKCDPPDHQPYDNVEEESEPPSGGIVVEIRPAEDYEEETTTHKRLPVTKKIKSMIEEHKIVTRIETVTVLEDDEGRKQIAITPREKPVDTFKLIAKTYVKNKGRRMRHRARVDDTMGNQRRRAPKRTQKRVQETNDRKRLVKKRRHHLKQRIKDDDDTSNSKKPSQDSIPAFYGRRLREVDYVYDPNLGYPDLEENFKELEKKSVTRPSAVMGRKDSVEGDYGDEEESATQKDARKDKLVKKTMNEFADPVTTSEEVEEYYDEYDAAADEGKANFGKRMHGKKTTKPKVAMDQAAQKKKQGKSKPKKKPSAASATRPQPSKTFLEDSEFQQWPRFVRNDRTKEETLRKRSLITQRNSPKQRNNFPISTKTFFVGTPRRPQNRAALADQPSTEPPPQNTLTLAEFGSIGPTDPNVNIGNALDINVKFEEPFNSSAVTVKGIDSLISSTLEICEGEPQVRVTNLCEENEMMFNHTEPAMTTALPIVPDSESLTAGYYEPLEKVDELLNGHIPFIIIEKMFNVMKKNQNFNKRFKSHVKRTRDPSMFAKVRETSEQESRKIVDQMSELIAKLQITTNCEILPPKLRFYLRTITKTKKGNVLEKSKSMEDIELDENQNQGTGKSYVFETGITADNMDEKITVLKTLLTKFEGLPEQCKPRAMPVKEYIQNHLGMLDKMVSRGGGDDKSPPSSNKPEEDESSDHQETQVNQPNSDAPKRIEKHSKFDDDDNTLSLSLIQKQLESLGLGKNKNFKPKFDLNELIAKNRHKKSLFEDEEDEREGEEDDEDEEEQRRISVSRKFHKLLDAIQKEKEKQNRVKRFDVVYGNEMGTRKTPSED